MSFKTESIINLKNLFHKSLFPTNDNNPYSIHDIDLYSGSLQVDYIFDFDCIDDDVDAYWEDYPEWTKEQLKDAIDYNLGFNNEDIKKELGELISTTLLPSGAKEALAKYGIILVKTEYDIPREYNFRSDMLDLHLEDSRETEDKGVEEELLPLMQRFLDSAPKSCDGYINLLPSTAQECQRLSIPHIFAILYKEGILEDVIDNIQDFIDEATQIIRDSAYSQLRDDLDKDYKEWCVEHL